MVSRTLCPSLVFTLTMSPHTHQQAVHYSLGLPPSDAAHVAGPGSALGSDPMEDGGPPSPQLARAIRRIANFKAADGSYKVCSGCHVLY
jgi:hypothetical protein